ncbi:hypothetical protein [Saccharolobus caldissimus]|uniref:Uncharacterized protein n=1 Tax=Saccharolobus caldissimus TaxID=1702097 RepID=A0AAQ4CVJ8_9CREN|nr:hypothetical protein [Saccharolobus caldissimus]BDB99829.1 hypothetical protein SACC_28460 [Saccharolobus caldissimus]
MLQEYARYLENNIENLKYALSSDPTRLCGWIVRAFKNIRVGLEKFGIDDVFVEKFTRK